MAYNNNKGPQHSGDIQFEGDPDETQIDFADDTIKFLTGGSRRLEVINTHVSASTPISASSFHGDGSRLQNVTGAAVITTYSNASDNRVITSVDSTSVQGEANLTFDGSALTVTGQLSASLGITGSDIALISNTPSLFISNSAGTGLGFVGFNTSDNLLLQNNVTNKHIVFKTNDAGTMKEGLRINGAVPEVVINEGSDSLVNFRVESDSNTHMVFVDGSENTVGINTSNPSHTLEVSGSYLLSGSARSSYTNRPQAGGYTILDTDNVIIFNNASTQVATLPRITTSNQGVMYYIKNIGGGAVTLTGSATFEQFIDGQQTLSLTQGDSAKVIGHGLGTGFGWSILSYYNV